MENRVYIVHESDNRTSPDFYSYKQAREYAQMVADRTGRKIEIDRVLMDRQGNFKSQSPSGVVSPKKRTTRKSGGAGNIIGDMLRGL